MVVFALILASIALSFRYGFAYKYGAGFILDPLLTAVFLVQVMVMGDSWLWGWLNWGVTRYMGRISYSMFLYHLLAIQVTAYLLPQRSLLRTTPVAVLLTALMGTCSYLSDRTKVPPSEIKIHSTSGSRTAGNRAAGPPHPAGCTRSAPPLAVVQT
jgi:peptidoglycan/LPS O-acetylase OafA/YrhL